ncbi:FAD-binding protein [Natronogracilivirga saccharolytica]|uniref:FAD-binding protein n=1 Tax=Natronogracilivirga saccharolytica TaxID=2812953 RepID=A0A8J7S829_9BACT|nr:FAD-binding protein [Natronogracilivirga saccharolytica]MBP3193663.1 FAD-binding protein [Natronogracilivirga saccharolytica]
MPNYIVLVKQVPDVSKITDNAFDPETGNLIRNKLASTINELDTKALAFAHDMRRKSKDSVGQIIALSMGPPMAEEVLRYSLGRCADQAILLTDRPLGGADTYATANPLACSIRKIVREIFEGDENYYVIAGMQSVDGDTAQVPAQVAEELQISCAANLTECQYENGEFIFTKIISGGSQKLTLKRTPAVLTVADFEYPLYAAFTRTRWARDFKLTVWSNDDIQAPYIGSKGSKTNVIEVFPPEKTTRKQQKIEDVGALAEIISKSLDGTNQQESAKEESGEKAYELPVHRSNPFDRSHEGKQKDVNDFALLAEKLKETGVARPDEITDELTEKLVEECKGTLPARAVRELIEGFKCVGPMYEGDVWVVAEQSGDGLHAGTLELTGEARKLADSLDVHVGVVLAGHHVEHLKEELYASGADKVYLIEDPLLGDSDPLACRKAISSCIETYRPQIVLFAATPHGRVIAPMISYRLGCGLTADCTQLEIKDKSRKGEIAVLMQTRPALGGNIMATICTQDSSCQMATVRPGVMKKPVMDYSGKGELIRFKAGLSDEDISLNIISTGYGQSGADLDADVIVSGGKGLLSRENFEHYIGTLCNALQDSFGIRAERGASRAAVEQGFIDRGHQVGQTGTSVGPKMYLAFGISGAIQHMIGVANSETIIAVNSDPSAPVFEHCDYYMVAKAEKIIPQLADKLAHQKNSVEV